MKIHCNIAKDLMPLYIDDVLSAESRAAVEEHLTGCEGCREYYRRMNGSELPEAGAEEVLSRLDEAERIKRLRRSMRFKRAVTIAVTAAAVALILAVGDIMVFHYQSYIPYEETGIRVTGDGEMFADKPYYSYRGEYWGEDAEGNRVAIFFLSSSYYSRNWEKPQEQNAQHVIRFHDGEDEDSVDKVYYLPEKYVKENRLEGFFCHDRTIFDSIISHSSNDEEMEAEMNKLIAEIEDEAVLVWSKE